MSKPTEDETKDVHEMLDKLREAAPSITSMVVIYLTAENRLQVGGTDNAKDWLDALVESGVAQRIASPLGNALEVEDPTP